MKNELDIRSSRDFGKYLGVPIITDKRNKRAYNFIIDKLRDRLVNWEEKKSFLSGLPHSHKLHHLCHPHIGVLL